MNKVLLALICILTSAALPMTVFGQGAVIRVVPLGEPETDMAIITKSPAHLNISVTTENKEAKDVWLLFVIDETTHDGLNEITLIDTNGPTTLEASDFKEPTGDKIPLENDANYVGDGKTYPGCTAPQTQYQVNAILSQMSQVYPTKSIRYVLVYGFDSVSSTGRVFEVKVDSTTHVNVLVLAQGRTNGESNGPLNSKSPFSGSTLIVPELGSVLIALASFSALATYAVKRRMKS